MNYVASFPNLGNAAPQGVHCADVEEVRPADAIDPAYGRTLREALAAGVEVVAWRAKVTPRAIVLDRRIRVACP